MNDKIRQEYNLYAEYAHCAHQMEERAMSDLTSGISFLEWPETITQMKAVSIIILDFCLFNTIQLKYQF
jgi:hypothetical protein